MSVRIKEISRKDLYPFFSVILFCIINFGFLAFSIKVLRSFFPIPKIGGERIVGYSHYTGYPLYFDQLIFFLTFFLVPVFLGILIAVRRKTNGKKN